MAQIIMFQNAIGHWDEKKSIVNMILSEKNRLRLNIHTHRHIHTKIQIIKKNF